MPPHTREVALLAVVGAAAHSLRHVNRLSERFRWRRTATPDEVAVAAAILQGYGDAASTALLQQFRKQGGIRRTMSGSRLQIAVPFTREDLLVELDRDVESKPVRVRDARTRQRLEFVLTLRRGGFFGSLTGLAERMIGRLRIVLPMAFVLVAIGGFVLTSDSHEVFVVLMLIADAFLSFIFGFTLVAARVRQT